MGGRTSVDTNPKNRGGEGHPTRVYPRPALGRVLLPVRRDPEKSGFTPDTRAEGTTSEAIPVWVQRVSEYGCYTKGT